MFYAIIDEENVLHSIMELPDGHLCNWSGPPGFKIIINDGFDIDPKYEYADYIYNDETGEFDLSPDAVDPGLIEYFDLETGNVSRITSEDIDAMVDEKVRNNVEAVMQQMIEDGTFSIPVASSPVDVVNEFGDQNAS